MWPAFLLILTPLLLSAGCLAPALSDPRSQCQAESSEVRLTSPLPVERIPVPSGLVDPSLDDPAFQSGVRLKGTLEFEWRLQGAHIVEIFLLEPNPPEASFTLLAAGQPVDRRFERFPGPDRLSPRRGRHVALAARVEQGPLTLHSDSPGFVLSAIRWTPVAGFESGRVPALRARLQELQRTPYFGIGERGASLRDARIDQVASLLRLSTDRSAQEDGLLGQARAAYWLAAENHRPKDLARTATLLRELVARMPSHPLVRQMVTASCATTNSGKEMAVGDFCQAVQPLPWTVTVPPDPPGAPRWATTQRRLKYRMEAITRWWVEQRQQSNGELGGGWGDDVEILRQWGPLGAGLGSEVAVRGILRLADGLWNSDELKDGYSRRVSDVEHSSEPSTDTLPLRAVMSPEDRTGRQRLRITARCAENWIAKQPDNHWRFRSSWFNCAEMDTSAARAVDVHLNTRAMGPALWSAYFDRDPKLIALLSNWAESWRNAMRSTAHGKPFGLIPSVLRSLDGSYLIGSSKWDEPQAEWDYFQWSGGSQEAIASLFLAVHDLTRDPKWLQAASDSFAILRNCRTYPRHCQEIRNNPEAQWVLARLTAKAPPVDRRKLLDHLAGLAEATEQRLSTNFDMYTSEALWTDRVYYRMSTEYRDHLFGGEAPRGDRYPMFAITWSPIEGEFARAVVQWSNRSMEIAAYNFEAGPITADARLWRLEKGDYRCHVIDSTGKLRYTSLFGMRGNPQLLRITLPARTEVTVKIEPATIGDGGATP